MGYYHIMVHEEAADWHDTLLFKDLSKEELRSPSLVRFISAAQPGALHPISQNSLRARVIRTERQHHTALEDYFREWDKEAMQASGYPTYSRPTGDRVIAVAGTDITEEFLKASRPPAPAPATPSFLASDTGLRSLGGDQIPKEIARGIGADYPGIGSPDGRKVTVKTPLKGAQDDLVERRLLCFRRDPPAAFFHVLVYEAENDSETTLLFKDLSEDQLRTPFLAEFLRRALGPRTKDVTGARGLRARVIRTEMRYDDEVTDALRAWQEKAAKARFAGLPVDAMSTDPSAICGIDITAEFIWRPRLPP
jgi:hypothetical protein